jgi:dynein heavy chain
MLRKFDDASIFAQIDAFVQRCSDLLEICEGQIQFSRKSSSAGGMSCNLPEFGGARGPEITKALLGIQASFEDQIDILKSLDYDILDVKTSRWHEDYNAFKNVVKDLEVMYTNVINTSFEGLTRVPDAVALLEIFYHLARKQAIRQTCLRKTIDVYVLFTTFVSDLRREFDEKRRLPPLRANEPPYSGSALWANSLGEMVSKSWEMLRCAKPVCTCPVMGLHPRLLDTLTLTSKALQASSQIRCEVSEGE